MRKIAYIIFACLFIITMCSCGQAESTELQNMTTMKTNDYTAIVWEDKIYIPFCAAENNRRGKQIGIVNDDVNDRVYEATGLSTDQWIISYYNSGMMDSSMLMKEKNLTDIPEGFYSEYEWNN